MTQVDILGYLLRLFGSLCPIVLGKDRWVQPTVHPRHDVTAGTVLKHLIEGKYYVDT